jgi:hypothetical protein
VLIETPRGDHKPPLEVEKVRYYFYDKTNNKVEQMGYVENFPFVAAYATTIDKTQGMTLDKVAVVLDTNEMRPNQVYVALSRAKRLSDIMLLDRRLGNHHIKTSGYLSRFYESIKSRIIDVHLAVSDSNAIINNITNICITVNNQAMTIN